jgi:hypothetical protein
MDKAIACLRANFRTNGAGDAGWYHYLDDPNPGVTASAVGLFCFQLAGVHFERTSEVVRYLASQQVKSSDKTDGGWSVRTTNGFPVVEATSWVVRALSTPAAGLVASGDALRRGAGYLEANQNTDFGWGSYSGQPSRVFHTALAMIALQGCGGNATTIENGQKWLINAQSPNDPAWGCVPGAEPTVLHTSWALLALLNVPGALSANSIKAAVDWLMARIEPGVHVEKSTTVEEFDVPYPQGNQVTVFQNSLPHYAGPIALTAVLTAGADPLQARIFSAISGILDSQLSAGVLGGAWELPRSPTRPSVWAIWPFLAALGAAKERVCTSTGAQANLLFDGCAIVQSEHGSKKVTRSLLLRNAFFDWLRAQKTHVALSTIAVICVVIPSWMLAAKKLDWKEFVTAMVLPALLLIFQLVWGLRERGRRSVT